MARRVLKFGIKRQTKAFTTPESLDLWVPKGRKYWARIYVLSHNDFARAAAKFGYAGRKVGGFATWGLWCWPTWQRDAMYFRADFLAKLILHEWQHIEEQSDFHGELHDGG